MVYAALRSVERRGQGVALAEVMADARKIIDKKLAA